MAESRGTKSHSKLVWEPPIFYGSYLIADGGALTKRAQERGLKGTLGGCECSIPYPKQCLLRVYNDAATEGAVQGLVVTSVAMNHTCCWCFYIRAWSRGFCF